MNEGPGYNIYYAAEDFRTIVFLCGGLKSDTRQDLKKAEQLWAEYKERKEEPLNFGH